MSVGLEGEVQEYDAMFRYDAKLFREMVEGVSKILDEALFVITSEGIRVVGMDPAKVALIEVELPSEAFIDFDFRGGERVEMGVNLEALKNAVKRGKKGEQLEVRVTTERVYLKIEGSVVKRYLLPNLEVVVDVPGEVKLEFDVTASVISDVVKKALKDIDLVGDIAEFEADEDSFTIRSFGEGRSRVEAKLTRDSPALLFLEVSSPASSRYDVGYLKKVLNLAKIAESIDIRFSSDKPLELVFKAPDGSRVRYLLAPSTA